MRRAALTAFAVVALAGLAALVSVAAADKRDMAFTLGVLPSSVAAELAPGSEACLRPVWVSEPFDRLQLQLGTYGRPGAPLAVTVRSRGGQELAHGRLAGGYPDVSQQQLAVDRVGTGRVSVCVENAGGRKVAIYGGPGEVSVGVLRIDGRRAPSDPAMVFLREEQRSVLALVPDIFDHAGVFKPGWVGAWTFWVLAVLVLMLVPLLLAAGLRAALNGSEAAAPDLAPTRAAAARKRKSAPVP